MREAHGVGQSQGLGRQAEVSGCDAAGNKESGRPGFNVVLTNTNCFGVALPAFGGARSAWDTGLFLIM